MNLHRDEGRNISLRAIFYAVLRDHVVGIKFAIVTEIEAKVGKG